MVILVVALSVSQANVVVVLKYHLHGTQCIILTNSTEFTEDDVLGYIQSPVRLVLRQTSALAPGGYMLLSTAN